MPRSKFNPVQHFLDTYALVHQNQKVYFIQIGANDGITGDPLYSLINRYKWQGIVIEPLPDIFRQLQQNYSHIPDIICENAALSPEDNNLTFYQVNDQTHTLPYWHHQLSSFKKPVIEKHSNRHVDLHQYIQPLNINRITWHELIRKYNINQTDLLCIDTEGFDYEILKMINFADTQVNTIIFEHRHLDQHEQSKAFQKLKTHGFVLYSFKLDTIAINTKSTFSATLIKHLTKLRKMYMH